MESARQKVRADHCTAFRFYSRTTSIQAIRCRRRPDFGALGTPATRDSFVAERLRAAGAVILGKTNLSEWANFRSTHSSSGWSGRGGQTKNPYALDRNPCGSSCRFGSSRFRKFIRHGGRNRDRWLRGLPIRDVRHRRDQTNFRTD